MKELKITGRARIGLLNIIGFSLELKATIFQVKGQEIKINHSNKSYKNKIIFCTFKNPKIVIKQIKETGFLAKIFTYF